MKRALFFWSVAVWLPMWPFISINCPLTPYVHDSVQMMLLRFHTNQNVPTHKKMLSNETELLPPVITLHGYSSESDVMQAVREHPYSTVLFKQYFPPDVASVVLRDFKRMTAGKQYLLVNATWGNPAEFGGFLSSPMIDFNGLDHFYNLVSENNQYFKGALHGIWNGSMQDVYGSFVPVGEGSLPSVVNFTSVEFARDTSFFGWLKKKRVTAAFHANWKSDTFSFQLAGRKQWIIVDPLDIKEVVLKQRAVHFFGRQGGVKYLNLHVDSHLQSKMKVVETNPGDLLYFPPHAGHTVVSDAGLNVMTALRMPAKMKSFNLHPCATFQVLFAYMINNIKQRVRYMLRLSAFNDHYDVEQYSQIEKAASFRSWEPFYNDPQVERILQTSTILRS